MKKMIIAALCVLLTVSLFACGEKAPGGADEADDKDIMGAVSLKNGNLALYDIPLGMNIKDAQKKMAEKGYVEEIEYENGMTALEYDFDEPLSVNGMEIEEISYISLEKDGKIDLFGLEVEELDVKKELVNSPEELKREVEKYFEKYQAPVRKIENTLETSLGGQSVMDGEKVIFDEGAMIYTCVFVNGETVPVSSKNIRDIAEIENAQVLEICCVTHPVTEEHANHILKDDDKTFSPAYVQFMTGNADALKYLAENGDVDF